MAPIKSLYCLPEENLSFQGSLVLNHQGRKEEKSELVSFRKLTECPFLFATSRLLKSLNTLDRHWFTMNQQIWHDNDPPRLHKPDESKHEACNYMFSSVMNLSASKQNNRVDFHTATILENSW